MTPVMGHVVRYRLTVQNAEFVNATYADPHRPETGNQVRPGDTFPAMIVKVWPSELVNLQVFLDGDASFWATSRAEGAGEGEWRA